MMEHLLEEGECVFFKIRFDLKQKDSYQMPLQCQELRSGADALACCLAAGSQIPQANSCLRKEFLLMLSARVLPFSSGFRQYCAPRKVFYERKGFCPI